LTAKLEQLKKQENKEAWKKYLVERFADFLERNYYHAYFDIKDGAYWLTVVDNYGVDRIMFFGTFAEVYDHIKKY